jgi:hypothetical protein
MTYGPIYQIVSVLVLAGLLFFPVSNIIWAISTQRLRRKLKRDLHAQEITGQRQRARFIAVFITLIFAYFFNLHILGSLYG